ncbi:MAG TPA: hypothetical protein VJ743_19865 [Albitalea sp.]|nr:hypothetical protein [Albitalea sp.]
MNRVLSWPHTPIVPGLLEGLKGERHRTRVTERATVHFDLLLGPVEMKFSDPRQQLAAGTEVYVWWKCGGFLCAPADDLDAEERASQQIAARVARARTQLAEARRERQAQLAAHVDIVLPGDAESPQQAAA